MLISTLVKGVVDDAANSSAPAFPLGSSVILPTTVVPLKNSAVMASAVKLSGSASNPKVDSAELKVSVISDAPIVQSTAGVQVSPAGGQLQVAHELVTWFRCTGVLKETVKLPPEMEL